MKDKPDFNKLKSDDECILPPDHPLPPDELGRYSPARDYYAEKDIADYVMTQAHGETVQNVERVNTEYVMAAPYEIWDVVTDKERWWVITNPTNLYSQRHFPSLDYTLSFHVGLMMRVRSQSERGAEPEATPFDEVLRRLHQASDLLDRAVEAIDFQAVGMQLRECLISLIATVRRRIEISVEEERPKDADVINWNKLLIGQLCPGSSNDDLRSYLRATTEKAWQLANWLTHHRNANKTAALIALDAVDAIVKHYVRLLSRERVDRIDQCPRCGSRKVRTFFDIAIEPDGAYFEQCGACEWDNHPGYPDEDEEVGVPGRRAD
jgi:hypothetical protein